MTYNDFFEMVEDTGSIIISKDLFKTLLDSPSRITAVEKKQIYNDGYEHGYSVSKAEKKGCWIEHKYNGVEYIECSRCSAWFLREHLTRNSYCPNCGHHMVEPQESEKERGNKR